MPSPDNCYRLLSPMGSSSLGSYRQKSRTLFKSSRARFNAGFLIPKRYLICFGESCSMRPMLSFVIRYPPVSICGANP